MFCSQIYTEGHSTGVGSVLTLLLFFSHYDFKLFSFSNLIAERKKTWDSGSEELWLEDTICTDKRVRCVS